MCYTAVIFKAGDFIISHKKVSKRVNACTYTHSLFLDGIYQQQTKTRDELEIQRRENYEKKGVRFNLRY